MHFLGSRFVTLQSQTGQKNPEMDEKLNRGKKRANTVTVVVDGDVSTFLPARIPGSVPIFLFYFQFYIST